MAQFFLDHLSEFAGIFTMAIAFFIMSFFSTKSNVDSIDKKRVAKGLAPMLEVEKQIIATELKTSVIGDFIGALVAGIAAMVVTNLLQ